MVSPAPDGYPRITTYLCVDGAVDAIEFYKSVLGVEERTRSEHEGKVGHAELALDDSLFMVSDEYPEMGVIGPRTLGGTPVAMTVYVEDADATFAAALAAGATELRPVQDQFYGDRSGQFEDPWGHRWGVSTHIEDIDHEEMARRAAAVMGGEEH